MAHLYTSIRVPKNQQWSEVLCPARVNIINFYTGVRCDQGIIQSGNRLGGVLKISPKFSDRLGRKLGSVAQAAYSQNPFIQSKLTNRPVSGMRRISQKLADIKQSPRAILNFSLVMVVVGLLVVGSLRNGESLAQLDSPTSAPLVKDEAPVAEVDSASTTFIAATVATELALPVAEQVQQMAADVANEIILGDQGVSKPQLAQTEGITRLSLRTYTVKEGDTIASVAVLFGISTDTLRWANDLSPGASLAVGTKLKILPVDGTLHTVTVADSVETLAEKYQTSTAQIISFNDLEVKQLEVGSKIIIPNGHQPAPVVSYSTTFSPNYRGNGYDWGWCTWWAAERRARLGAPIPTNWGNANTWAHYARLSGHTVSAVPQAGAVIWHQYGGWLGHVGVVEKVNGGSITVSDMNYPTWGTVTTRTVPASEYGSYLFIY